MSAQKPPAAVPIRRGEQPSMRDLLASCAAANAVSTPPEEQSEPVDECRDHDEERDAA
ncbi:hypothetical protein [Streptomyces sp. XD-27]|uniref:hypothetical protein n=1 Tax=Streptomyces sp. XD-27 TaxID=3062779 RepID=UPI0026F429CD|nr:hypothetical protein [Streptomyces sp. XD-27]WKX72047.1 hypothetical protein Q3Y56_20985 [Streptomyces sp. XD-27]